MFYELICLISVGSLYHPLLQQNPLSLRM